ncbi:glycine-rich domain-containing protein [Chryseobacterium gleum]|uniref:glycine-rich domain-containing protein n=1 Tax=Chryseobacterium gleum TaxID=250 RepID=UPI00241E3578|nr:hypothetical protein [Chryseobacterium gleum]
METKMIVKDESLWKRIQEFSLDTPGVDFPFSKKLAKEENWSPDFARKAIEEYKKFVYLCCILPRGASPSKIVDKVWHMHLIYTRNYWEEFCPDILKKPLHHHPSNGGIAEREKHKNWFEDTLAAYRKVFQQEAPEEIWKMREKKSKVHTWIKKIASFTPVFILLMLFSCTEGNGFTGLLITGVVFAVIFILGVVVSVIGDHEASDPDGKKKADNDGGSCGGSNCGGGCGGGCGGCGGCGG